MSGDSILKRFVETSPLAVMTRAILHEMIDAEAFEQVFRDHRSRQYDSTIKFSVLAKTMSEIALGTKRNRNQAYLKYKDRLGASKEAYYTKLNRTEPQISEQVVHYGAQKAVGLLEQLGFQPWEVLPGYNCYSIDGNHLQKTEKRLKETRSLWAAPLPGTTVARFNHQTAVFEKAYLLEDAHAQECEIIGRVIEDVRPRDLLIADRHFCILRMFLGVHGAGGCFLIRQNSRLKGELIGERKRRGKTSTGVVFEQAITLRYEQQEIVARRVTIELEEPTKDGDAEIHLLCNIPSEHADGREIADAYLRRWEIENAFHILTMTFNCEMKSNCYPKCALFLFCMAMFAYNARMVLLAALYSQHDCEDVDRMSQYQISVDTIEPMPGMLTAINEREWSKQIPSTPAGLADFLREVAGQVEPRKYRKQVRGPKKPKPPRVKCKTGTHVSVAKILAKRRL